MMSFPVKLQTIKIDKNPSKLFIPDEKAVKTAYNQRKISFPYWSKLWPSAIALSKFISQNTCHVKNKKIVELGAGLGLPSLVAAGYAASVLCTDSAAEAVAIAQQSATHNCLLNFKTAVIDWNHLADNFEADVVLLSDVNYEPASFDRLLKMINDFLQTGITILISTPQRLMAKDFINPLLQHVIQEEEIVVERKGEKTRVTILVLAANKE